MSIVALKRKVNARSNISKRQITSIAVPSSQPGPNAKRGLVARTSGTVVNNHKKDIKSYNKRMENPVNVVNISVNNSHESGFSINGKKNISFEKKINNISKKVEIFYSSYEPINIEKFKGKKILAFAGIGNPNNFFDMLTENNIDLQKKIAFPDHYKFNENEIKKIIYEASEKNLTILTSEKDYYRLKKFNFKEINYIKIKLKINNEDKFIKKIENFI